MKMHDWSNWRTLFQFIEGNPLLFNSGQFFLFFMVLLIFYQIIYRYAEFRIFGLLIFSLFFYYKASGIFVALIVLTASYDFLIGLALGMRKPIVPRIALVTLSIFLGLGILGYFKYTNFIFDSYAQLSKSQPIFYSIILPIGISFYTFQSLSYTISVYRREILPVKRFQDYLFFLSFFPHLVAGPIVKAKDFLPQIRSKLLMSRTRLGAATFLIITGLFKKCIIADYISLNFVDRVFDNPTLYTGFENLMATYGYAIQIYCDFSGYSDIAIGIAAYLGFDLGINFNAPYKSLSLTEFWRRWHISLSTWLRSFLYIPLGGNRKGPFRQNINLLITMLLGGLWHGASVNFIIWGGLHGLGLVIDKLLPTKNLKGKIWFIVFQWFITFHFVCFCWLFFRSQSLSSVFEMLNQITLSFHAEIIGQFFAGYKYVAIFMIIAVLMHSLSAKAYNRLRARFAVLPVFGQGVALAAIVILVVQMQSSTIQPFIYFQF